jgi:hypothetical protein
MTMLVQPRHMKLYYAGQAKNWQLAAFQINELRGALARIGRTIPNYRNINVDTAVASIFADNSKRWTPRSKQPIWPSSMPRSRRPLVLNRIHQR